MDCSQIEKLIAVHPDDLTDQEQVQLQEHIKACENCREEYELMGSLDSVVSRSLEQFEGEPNPQIPGIPQISKQNTSKSFTVIFSYAWAAAATILLVAGAVFYFSTAAPVREELTILKAEVKDMKEKAEHAEILAVKLEAAHKQIAMYESQARVQTERIAELEKKDSQAPRTVNFNFFGNKREQAETARNLIPSLPMSIRNYQGAYNETTYH